MKYWCDLQLVFYYPKISNFLWRKNEAYYTPIGVLYPDRVYTPIGTFLQPAKLITNKSDHLTGPVILRNAYFQCLGPDSKVVTFYKK